MKDVLSFYDFSELLSGLEDAMNCPDCDLIGNVGFSKWRSLSYFGYKVCDRTYFKLRSLSWWKLRIIKDLNGRGVVVVAFSRVSLRRVKISSWLSRNSVNMMIFGDGRDLFFFNF